MTLFPASIKYSDNTWHSWQMLATRQTFFLGVAGAATLRLVICTRAAELRLWWNTICSGCFFKRIIEIRTVAIYQAVATWLTRWICWAQNGLVNERQREHHASSCCYGCILLKEKNVGMWLEQVLSNFWPESYIF